MKNCHNEQLLPFSHAATKRQELLKWKKCSNFTLKTGLCTERKLACRVERAKRFEFAFRSNWKRCRSVRWSLTFRCWPSTTSVTTPSIQISTSTLSQWPFWGRIKRRPSEKCLAMEEPDPVSLFCLAELEKVWSALLCAARSGRKRVSLSFMV